MITIIFGPPRIGKTAFMVYLLNLRAYDFERNRAMQRSIMKKNANGFKLTVPTHCASANFEITFRKNGYMPRKSRIIDPKKLGFGGEGRETHFLLPYETIGIMEAQEYFNSRKYAEFKPWQSNLFEQHGHNHLDIIMDTQRPGLIDLNIRELARFIEIRSLDVEYDNHLWFKTITWVIREFDNVGLVDEYMRSGKRDTSCYTERRIVYNYNVLDMYDSYSCEPKFYAGHLNQDFDLKYGNMVCETKEDYIQYLEDIKEVA